jgi:DNA modification methylase
MRFLEEIKPEPIIIGNKHFLYTEDCLNILKQIPDKKIKLVITDPPYNIGLKYNYYKDNVAWEDYYKQLEERLAQIARILTDDGSLYWINYPEINAKTMPLIDKTGLIFRRWLTWHYPTNTGHSDTNYTKSQRSILFYTKSRKNTFNKNQILQPYKNPDVGKIKKLIASGKTGRVPYDTLNMQDLFEIFKEENPSVLYFNLLKNVSKEREINHPCQLPPALLKVFIKASSNPGDIILDCYAGTFTTSLAAKELGRKSVGIDIDKRYVEYGKKRLENG